MPQIYTNDFIEEVNTSLSSEISELKIADTEIAPSEVQKGISLRYGAMLCLIDYTKSFKYPFIHANVGFVFCTDVIKYVKGIFDIALLVGNGDLGVAVSAGFNIVLKNFYVILRGGLNIFLGSPVRSHLSFGFGSKIAKNLNLEVSFTSSELSANNRAKNFSEYISNIYEQKAPSTASSILTNKVFDPLSRLLGQFAKAVVREIAKDKLNAQNIETLLRYGTFRTRQKEKENPVGAFTSSSLIFINFLNRSAEVLDEEEANELLEALLSLEAIGPNINVIGEKYAAAYKAIVNEDKSPIENAASILQAIIEDKSSIPAPIYIINISFTTKCS